MSALRKEQMKGTSSDLYEAKGKNLSEWYIGRLPFVRKFRNGVESFGTEFFMSATYKFHPSGQFESPLKC